MRGSRNFFPGGGGGGGGGARRGGVVGPDPLKILSCMCFYRNKHLDPPPPGKNGPPLNPVPKARKQS